MCDRVGTGTAERFVSVIIPTKNEETIIATTVSRVREGAGPSLAEIIIVDGGSTGTLALAAHPYYCTINLA